VVRTALLQRAGWRQEADNDEKHKAETQKGPLGGTLAGEQQLGRDAGWVARGPQGEKAVSRCACHRTP